MPEDALPLAKQIDPNVPLIRTAAAGGLMGAANLVPGVSGGTMVLVIGVYDRFIDAVAGVSRGKITRDRVIFLAVLIVAAAAVAVSFAKLMTNLFVDHEATMKALFIGMTLAGTPPLWKMAAPKLPNRGLVLTAIAVGFVIMLALALGEDANAREQARALRETEAFRPQPAMARDAVGGVLAMSAMVLPGISGAYMLLLLGRYEHVTGAISLLKDGLVGANSADIMTSLSILVPVGVAAVVSLVLLSNLLKSLLEKHERLMGGLLLGVLWGSVFAIWPFTGASTPAAIGVGLAAAVAGFAAVLSLSFIAPVKPTA